MDQQKIYPLPPVKEEKVYPLAGATESPLAGEALDQRTLQYHVALGDTSPGTDEIKRNLASGNESPYQNTLVSNEMQKRVETGRKLVYDNVQAGTDADPRLIASLADPGQPPEKDGLVEGEYVKKVIDQLVSTGDYSAFEKAYNEDPMGLDDKYRGLEDVAWKNQIARSWKAKAEQDRKASGWVPYLAESAMQMLWFPTYANIVGNAPEGAQSSSWGTGNALGEKVEYVYSLPPAEMDRAIRAEMEALSRVNSLDAEMFANALVQYSAADVDLNTLNDLSIIPAGMLAKGAKAALKEANASKAITEAVQAAKKAEGRVVAGEAKNAVGDPSKPLERDIPDEARDFWGLDDPVDAELKAATRAASSVTDIPTALSGTGKPREAAQYVLRQRMAEEALPNAAKSEQRAFADILQTVGSWVKPTVKTNTGDNFYTSWLSDSEDLFRRFVDDYKKVNDLLKVSRTPEQIWQAAADKTEAWMSQQYAHVEDRIMDIERVLPGTSGTDVGQVRWYVGAEGKVPFEDPMEAAANIRALGLDPSTTTVRPVNTGRGYAIEVWSHVGEDKVADQVNQAAENQMRNITNPRVRGWLSSRMQTSDFQSMQRNTVVQSEAKMRSVVEKWYKPYKDLSYREQKALNKVMKANQLEERIPGDPTTRGTYYRNQQELEKAFIRHTGRLPTKAESKAYASMVYANNLHWAMSNKILYKLKASQDFGRITTSRMVEEGAIANTTFEGRVVYPKDFPLDSSHNIDVLMIDEQGIVSKVNLKTATESERKFLRDAIDRGHHIVQPWNKEDSKVLQLASTEDPVNFIITPDVKKSPLNLSNQVNYRPGWHNIYKSQFFIKQPKIRNGKYFGDTTILGFDTEKQMRTHGPALEEARKLFAAGKFGELDAHIKSSGLPFTSKKFIDTIMSRLDKDTPLSFVRHAQKSTDGEFVSGGKWADHFADVDTESEKLFDPSHGFVDPFTAKRDPVLWTIKNRGTEDAPLFELADASMVDPMLSQTRAMGKLMQSDLYNDYQMTAAQHWVDTFKDNIFVGDKKVSREDLRRAPIYYLKVGEVKGDPAIVRQGTQTKLAIEQLVGQPSQLAEDIAVFRHKTIAPIVEKYLGEKYLEYIPDTALGMITNPVHYLRSAAFHVKLGLFNPVQFFVQGAAVSNIVLVSPKAGALSFVPSTFFRMVRSTDDPSVIAEFGKKLEAAMPGSGWTGKMFEDSLRLYRKTGMDDIGSTAFKDHDGDPKLFRSKLGSFFLDKGPVFFNGAEKAIRATAWNTAYYEYAAKNAKKIGKFNEYDIAKIKDRAMALSGNMTRDSNAFWQNDARFSLFTQFQSYNARMAELMFGHQLERGERIRLIVGQGALWGLPIGAAGVYAVQNGDYSVLNPFSEDLRIHARNNGVNLEDSTVDAIYRGLISTAYGWISGDDYDFGGRYGMSAPRFMENLRRNMTQNGDLMGIIITALGPSGSVVNDIFKESSNVYNSISDLVSQDATKGELLDTDLANLLKEFSGPSTALKLGAAINQSVNRSQSGVLMDDTQDPLHDSLRILLGVEDIDVTDAYNQLSQDKSDEKSHQSHRKQAQRYVANAMDAWGKGDGETADRYMKAAKAYLIAKNFQPEEIEAMLFPGGKYFKEFAESVFDDHMRKVKDPQVRINLQQDFERRFGN